ncbi:type II secretion system protein GspK [Cellvibrio fibrivorans]|uniref:T2SS protein K first SAM-like domain-containing protein n=1 Tax=Cellvibrio fibrivorans TaxID=126350 RepID=A0ABU1UU54_9GAMM|nr:type II secretion system protein GspK [Cellvibrio fibrivorans]MDR7088704.1 hypothetical protein [Cellvibrio fibrivorans]
MVVKSVPDPSQQGFILAAVLWALVCMLVAVGFFHAVVERKLAIGLEARAQISNRLDLHSTEQTMLYLLATSRFTLAGMSFSPLTQEQLRSDETAFLLPVGDELRLDGVQYKGLGGTYFSLQDNAGLLSLNSLDEAHLERFLKHQGATNTERARLMAAKADYIDVDDQERLSGAESSQYRARQMQIPPNDFLRTPAELVRIMGWREQMTNFSLSRYDDVFNARRFSLTNINAMPEYLMVKYLGLTESAASLLYSERQSNPVRTLSDFMLRTNYQTRIDEDTFGYFPSQEISLRFWSEGGGQARLISLQLTPNGLLGPWLVDYEYSVEPPEINNEPLAIRQSNLFNPTLDDVIREH